MLITIFLLIGCNYPSAENTFQPDNSQSLTAYSTPYVKVQFNLILNQPLSSGEKVNIVLLDEVTGLPYNRQEYEMDQTNGNSYTVTLSTPMLSVLKYRYEKVGQIVTPEKNMSGQTIRYRMYHVQDDGIVNDILSSWDEQNTFTSTGRFEGFVIDQNTGIPVPDILVSVGGQLNFTDANGQVNFDGLPPGTHNVVFYAIDGSYQTFQQGALISVGKTTPAKIQMSPNKPVNVTFSVVPPNDAIGAPVYLAGNFAQLGNTYSDLQGSMSIDSNRLPEFTPQIDGNLIKTLTLYAGTDLRFKFTLGDGYWNAELSNDSEVITRQLIVPDQNITLELEIDTWRTQVFKPITFETFIHPEIGYPGERYIQFKLGEWTEPIRLWPLGNGNYLYILHSPFEINSTISYRICLSKTCDTTMTDEFVSPEAQIDPTDQPITQIITVDHWLSPPSHNPQENITLAVFPYKPNTFHSIIELSPEMTPGWFSSLPVVLDEINEMDTNIVIISPQWTENQSSGLLQPEIGVTPFSYEMTNYISEIHNLGHDIGLYPQIATDNNQLILFDWADQNNNWREEWFESYRQLILNYAKIAEYSGVDYLLIGGKPLLSTLPDENSIYLEEKLEKEWRSLISEIRQQFHGNLIWVTNIGIQMDPLPSFIDLFDEIYISVDSPLASDSNPSFEQISYNFTSVIDNYIYEVYRSTLKPITIALAYPSVEGSVLGCQLIENDCNNDGLFTQNELLEYDVDVQAQADIYNAILPVTASREWITGISIRGFNPTGNPLDPSSSIWDKPAQDVIEYWYKGLNNN